MGCDVPMWHNVTISGVISIHAPRVGCDEYDKAEAEGLLYFNPRTPCGVRPKTAGWSLRASEFQSTHPVWGATKVYIGTMAELEFQSTHPVWGATEKGGKEMTDIQFQSTHPVWGATGPATKLTSMGLISIHAPRVGCDEAYERFNNEYAIFQSTHPVWGATTL